MSQENNQQYETPQSSPEERAKTLLAESRVGLEGQVDGKTVLRVQTDKGGVLRVVVTEKNEQREAICTCDEYRRQGLCPHQIAALSLLDKPVVPLPEKIRIRDVTALASDHDLRAFISSEARRNRHLALRLKARFIDEVNLKEGINKYAVLLDEIITTNTSGDLTLSLREIRLLDQIAGLLLDSASRYIVLRTFTEASQILLTILSRLHLCVDKHGVQQPEMTDRLVAGYELLIKLLHGEPAPALCDMIYRDGMQLLGRGYYQLPDAQANIVPVLLECSSGRHDVREISRVIFSKLRSSDNPALWAAWYLYTCEAADLEFQTDSLRELLTGGQIFSAVTILDALQDKDATDRIIVRLYPGTVLPEHQQIQWAQRLLKYAQRNGDTRLALESGLALISATGQTEIVDTLARMLDAHPETRQQLAEELQKVGDVHGLARLYVAEGNDRALLALLRETKSLELAIAYTPQLLKSDRAEAVETLRATTVHYATHHAGPVCLENIQALLTRLHSIGESVLVRQLRKFLAHEFPGRFR